MHVLAILGEKLFLGRIDFFPLHPLRIQALISFISYANCNPYKHANGTFDHFFHLFIGKFSVSLSLPVVIHIGHATSAMICAYE